MLDMRLRTPWSSCLAAARISLCLALCLTLASCGPRQKPVPPVTESGQLVVITRNSPTTYFENAQGQEVGLEHDLVALFAKQLGVPVRFIVATRFDAILPAIAAGQANLAAAGLTITPQRSREVRFGPPYQTVQEVVVYNTDFAKPRSIADLVGKDIEVVAGSSYVRTLEKLRQQYPGLRWHAIPTEESEELLGRLAKGDTDYVIADSDVFAMARILHPNLAIGLVLAPRDELAWAFPKHGDGGLYQKAQKFFQEIARNGTLTRLLNRYYAHLKAVSPPDVAGFFQKLDKTLPKYLPFFEEAQDATGIDWRLLAAIAYQESQWDPLATSPTGVRGIMMLTNATADQMDVKNRLEPGPSILAGARYLLSLKHAVPGRIKEPDRMWLALAAYNVGFAHLEDARILAQRMRLNPDSWADVASVLPRLSETKYYSTLKHGYCRGGEAVAFVANIRTYYDILTRMNPHAASAPPSLTAALGDTRLGHQPTPFNLAWPLPPQKFSLPRRDIP